MTVAALKATTPTTDHATLLIWRKRITGGKPMTENTDYTTDPECVGNCDEAFIACVESEALDCLEKFRACDDACRY